MSDAARATPEKMVRRAIGKWSRDGNEDLEDLVAILVKDVRAYAAEQTAHLQHELTETNKLVGTMTAKYASACGQMAALRQENAAILESLDEMQREHICAHLEPKIIKAFKEKMERETAALRAALVKAHACATLRDDGTCDGCFVSEVLLAAPEGR